MSIINNLKLKIKNWNLILILILLVAAIFRLWNLGSIPPSLNPDEAALGYNAYSILKTGKDEYGKFLPLIFKSFGDYKPGLYVYLDVPFVAVFGLNEASTRLPSALAGIASVFLVYLITKKLFNSTENFAALIAATNPWLIYFSRAAWEANISIMFTLLGIYFFLKSFKNHKYIILTSLSLSLTLITYQGAKLSTLIVVFLLLIIYWKEFWKINRKYILLSVVLGVIVSFPIILSLFNGETQRLTIYSIFSYRRPIEYLTTFLTQGQEKIGGLSYYLFHAEGLNFIRAVMGRWFNNFSGKFLFFTGDWANPINSAPYQGMLLLSDLIFLPLGLFVTFKNKLSKGQLFIIFWLLLAPFSASLSRDEVNAVRNLNMAIPLIFIISFGVFYLVSEFRNFRLHVLFYILISIFYILSLSYFVDAYYIHVPAHNSNFWRYGYKQVVETIEPIENKYNNIIIEQSFNQPYIYFLHYQKYDPTKWQMQSKLVDSQYKGDVGFHENIDNIQFKQIDLSVLRNQHGTLVVGSPTSFPPVTSSEFEGFKLIKEIKYLNNRDTAFIIAEVK